MKKEPKTWLSKFLLNEKMILSIIVLNTIVIFLEESGIHNKFLLFIDLSCTIIFIMEMIVKHIYYGFHGYWSSGWNRLDGILVFLSIPSLILFFQGSRWNKDTG